MKILAAGGGSGGHVTPVVAVLREIREHSPDAEIQFWCDTKFELQAKSIIAAFDPKLQVSTIHSGKLRRYHSMSMWRQLSSLRMIVFPNIRDVFLTFLGFLESFWKLMIWKPDVVFTKGGFVCLPIGLAAHLLKIPLVIHDSDAHPGLTNRVLAKWATTIATGAPLKFYPYPLVKSHYVGVPIGQAFARPFDSSERRQLKTNLGLDPSRPLVVITGGGLGARRLNNAILSILTPLTVQSNVILVSGEAHYDELKRSTDTTNSAFRLIGFISTGMAELLGAADVVVTRAGATTILELASLAKPTILVPNGLLTGGHQLKNAAVYAERGAVSVVLEDAIDRSPDVLLDEIINLLSDDARRSAMGGAFRQFSRPNAAHDMAQLVLGAIKRK